MDQQDYLYAICSHKQQSEWAIIRKVDNADFREWEFYLGGIDSQEKAMTIAAALNSCDFMNANKKVFGFVS